MRNKKTIALLACASLAVCAAALAGCQEPNTWNVSKDSASSVTAKLVENDSGYTLQISGKGKMRSYKNGEDLPWKDHLKEITKISVGNEVENVGSYAFCGIAVDYILLPQSVVTLGDGVVDASVKLFTENAEIDCGEANIYYYSEKAPETNDVFWQSDQTKSDIVDMIEGANGKQYWHENAEGELVVWETTKVLFVGNSFTYRNGVVEYSSGVPGIFDEIAENLGYAVETYSVTGPGWYLKNHAKASDTCGKQIDALLQKFDDFDVVVLQEQSTNPYRNYSDFLGGVKAMQEKIQQTQKHAQIYLYETWGSPYTANEDKTTIPQMESKLRKAYEDAAKECNLKVSYVGKAFTDIYRHEKEIYLWASDNRHQGYTGAYLSACVHVGTILGGDVRKTTFSANKEYQAPDLPETTLTALRSSAYNVVFGEVDETDIEEKASLEIGVWGRFITEEQFKKVFEGFKTYCQKKGLDASKAHYTYYTGASNSDPYYYIAAFTAATVENGGADIIFPCATNLTTQNGTNIHEAEIKPIGVTINGRDDRCVAKLTDNEYSNAFYEFCTSDEAKAIFASL